MSYKRSLCTRPDIIASVEILSKKKNCPTTTDWIEAKQITRYIKGTIKYKLRLGNHKVKNGELIGYTDANWAESRTDRKSNSGYIIKYWESVISWACHKQSCVAILSTEVEYISLNEEWQKCRE